MTQVSPHSATLGHSPTVARATLAGESLLLEGPCLVSVVRGNLQARDRDGECVRAEPGDLLSVAPEARCRLGGSRETGEILLFRARGDWARWAADLAGAELPSHGTCFHVDRCGSDRARRAARILRELDLRGHDEDRLAELLAASRHLELLAIAFAPRAGVLEPGVRRAGAPAVARRQRFREIVAALADEPLEGVTLASVADRLGASERQASRLFRSELGTPFREYLVRLRIERARRLLRETGLSVIEVAAETGWSSLAHFTTTFRRRVGRTPTGYRASLTAQRAA